MGDLVHLAGLVGLGDPCGLGYLGNLDVLGGLVCVDGLRNFCSHGYVSGVAGLCFSGLSVLCLWSAWSW